MKFFIRPNEFGQQISLMYKEDDYSFFIEPFEGGGGASILINDLQLEIDDDGKVLYVWGYCPLINVEETSDFPKKIKRNGLYVLLGSKVVPGMSFRLNSENRWTAHINKKTGWICIGSPEINSVELIEFAPSCVASLIGENLVGVWLQPQFV